MPARRQLIWLPGAARDLERLRRFLGSRNPDAARRAARQILGAVKILEKYPQAGRPVEDLAEFRDLFIPFGGRGYILRYRLSTDGDVVVVRVWHGKEERKPR